MDATPVLVAGATGYVGGRLVPRLLRAGCRVRAAARSPAKVRCRPWARHPLAEIVPCDVLDQASLRKALDGCRAAFYLLPSPDAGGGRNAAAAARSMAAAAAAAGLRQIICLGRLTSADSRAAGRRPRAADDATEILQSGPVPVTVLKAVMILGSGSAAFEVIRYLADRLPVMLAPAWFTTAIQPIAVRNVLYYLEKCLDNAATFGQTFDIGGPDILSCQDLIEIYAEEAMLPRRMIIPMPLLGPPLSSCWIHLVTPVPAAIARSLAAGVTANTICRDNRVVSLIPQRLLTCREAIRLALDRVHQQLIETSWSDAGELRPPEWTDCGDARYAGGTIMQCGYRIRLEAPAEEVWKPITEIGGQTGWYFGHLLWSLRGWLDRLMGGAGLGRGRRHRSQLYVGDALDFWRVIEVQPNRHLVLLAEMKVPGEALLEFRIQPLPDGCTELQQLARFLPKGLLGIVYWYGLYPIHQWLFRGLVRAIARAVGRPVTSGPDSLSS